MILMHTFDSVYRRWMFECGQKRLGRSRLSSSHFLSITPWLPAGV